MNTVITLTFSVCAVRCELTNMKLVPKSKKDTATAPCINSYDDDEVSDDDDFDGDDDHDC